MRQRIDVKVGDRFGRLTIIGERIDRNKVVYFPCRCDCGATKEVRWNNLQSGTTKSCGCYRTQIIRERSYVHGETRTRLYNTWIRMRDRCNNPKNKQYENYGGRGIKVCDEWERSYEAFKKWSCENGYDEKLNGFQSSIDRIDNNKGYSPDNCRWVDMLTQGNNKSTNKRITYNGKTQTYSQWGRELGINPHTIRYRYVLGYCLDDVFYKGNLIYKH